MQKISADGNPISPDTPWQAQRYVDIETEICTTVTVKNNQLKLISSTKSSPSQLRYHHMDVPFAKKWILEFCAKLQAANEEFSGQFCLDFLKCRKTKKFFPIECNPRIHSLTCVYNSYALVLYPFFNSLKILIPQSCRESASIKH